MIQQQIKQVHADWNSLILAYRAQESKAAEAENTYRRERAKFIIVARDADPKLSQAAAESLADADENVMNLRLARVAAEAEVRAMVEKLRWFRSRADALRSEKVDERMANKLYSENAV